MRQPAQRVAGHVVGWGVALLLFFPIAWMVLTSFKTESDAITPALGFHADARLVPRGACARRLSRLRLNSVVVSVGGTVLALLFAIPAAYAMAFHPTQRTRGTLLWMLSTKMLPPVGVLVPIYLLFRTAGLLDTRSGLVGDLCADEPADRRLDAVHLLQGGAQRDPRGRPHGRRATLGEVWFLLLPLTLPGVASTGLLSLILCWNEAFWSLNLTSSAAAPLTAFIASFSSAEGLFFAKLSAASTIAVAPILVFGWFSQRQLVRGLTFGAVK